MKIKKLVVAVSCLLLTSGAAQATLMEGSYLGFRVYNVDTGLTFPDPVNGNRLVDPNITYTSQRATTVLSDSNIDLTYITQLAWAPWVGYEYFDAFGTMDPFTEVTFNSVTNLIGLDASDLSFDADHIWVKMGGVSAFPGARLSIDVASVMTPIPEPTTYAMLLAGLGLLGLTAKRRGLRLKD